MAYFLVPKGVALSRCEPWSFAALHPVSEYISSQDVSALLRRISEDARQRFFSLWMNQVLEQDYLCYDITSVSSYARNNEYLHWGYNRDGDSLEQINLAMLFGQNTRLPVYYRRLPGNISDVATLNTTVKSLDFLGTGSMHLVLDRGFYSKANVDELYRRKHKFTIAVPTSRKWVEYIL
ncbi:transposase, partial [bacterium M21]